MIDRRQFFRRFCGAAVSVALAPVDAFQIPELDAWAPIYGKPLVEDLELIQSQLNATLHNIYTKAIVANVQRHTSLLQAFVDQPEYRMAGERLVFAVDLKYPVR